VVEFRFTSLVHFNEIKASNLFSCPTHSLFLINTPLNRSKLMLPRRNVQQDLHFPNRRFFCKEKVSSDKDTPGFVRLSDIAILSQLNLLLPTLTRLIIAGKILVT